VADYSGARDDGFLATVFRQSITTVDGGGGGGSILLSLYR